MRRQIRKLRTWQGRVIRDIERKTTAMPDALKVKLEIARRLHAQRREDKSKLYALYAPEVECLAVEFQEVVHSRDAAHGWLAVECAVWAMPVVAMR